MKSAEKTAALTTLPRILPLAILLGFPVLADAIAAAAIFDDYIQCRDQAQFGFPNGSLVCDPEARLLPKATAHLQTMLRDLERNVPCDCPPMECQRGDGRGDQFMALLMVLNEQRVEQDGGEPALREVAERIWEDAQMGSDKCANGILLVYIRDRRKMATYQGHGRFNLLSDQQLTDVHSLDFLTANGTGSVVPLGGDGSPALTQVRRATDDESFIGLSAIGLSIALALTFLVLVILLALLLAKCCRMCCPPRATRKGSKYYVNPMPSYKSIEPIYVVTPPGSEAFAAPPSFTSAYGTGTFGPPRPVMYGQPPLPPFVQHPRSRSATPTSTQRIRRTYAPSSTRTAQSIHSTPEPNKRDKVNRSATIGNGIGTFPTPEAGPSTSQQQQGQTPKKMSKASPTIQEAEQPHAQRHQVQPPPPPLHLHSTIAPQILPFLDPLRRQEVQTKEQFIG